MLKDPNPNQCRIASKRMTSPPVPLIPELTMIDLGSQDDFPPPPYDDEFLDCTVENKVYETCT